MLPMLKGYFTDFSRIFVSHVKFDVVDIRRIIDQKQNIRNVFIIAHVKHGKQLSI